jgi:F-type H+-transporting ATPase subunit b
MRMLSLSAALLAGQAAVASAQEAAEGAHAGGGGLMSLQVNLMFWTLIIFVLLYIILSKFAFKPITAAVDAREKALEELIDGARRDREAAARLLAEHEAAIAAARGDAQKLIAEGRAVAEKMRSDLLESTRREQGEMLDRARLEIERERERAIIELRKQAVDLALAGASKVIEANLESERNRKLVESFLAEISTEKAAR